MKNMRWLPVVGTVLFASGCGVILGMLLLTLFVDVDVEASKNQLHTAELPKVVQASEIMDMHDLENDLAVNGEIQENSLQQQVVKENNKTEKNTIDFPNKKWYFVQAGVFHTPEYAYPIEQQLKVKGFAFQMYGMDPARLMIACFSDSKQTNEMVTMWSFLGVELYAKELEVSMKPISVYLPEGAENNGEALEEAILLFYEQLAQTSYQLLKGNDADLQALQSKKSDLLEAIDQLLAIDENKGHQFLLNLKGKLEQSEPIVNGNKQLGNHMQELLLSLFVLSDIKEVK